MLNIYPGSDEENTIIFETAKIGENNNETFTKIEITEEFYSTWFTGTILDYTASAEIENFHNIFKFQNKMN